MISALERGLSGPFPVAQFLEDLRGSYDTIGVWHVGNEGLRDYFLRHGFRPATLDIDPWTEGALWAR